MYKMRKLLFFLLVFCTTSCIADSAGSVSRFFGEWAITESLDSTGVSALSSEELKAMKGKILSLQKNKVQLNNEHCGTGEYKVVQVSRNKLLQEIHYADDRDPLLPPVVTQVDAGCLYVFERTDGSLLLVWGGDIFVAKRFGRNR